MLKIKLTKGELKKQRDALIQYERYLPTLRLKQQQLQMEILRQGSLLQEKKHQEAEKFRAINAWAGLLAEPQVDLRRWLAPKERQSLKNIAGVDIPVFEGVDFAAAEYDLFILPLWVDKAIDELRAFVALRQNVRLIERGIDALKQELRLTTQRVNLFEKVKIPQAEEAIRRIKIYIGDQMANAVGRSKIAKNKIEAAQEDSLAVWN